ICFYTSLRSPAPEERNVYRTQQTRPLAPEERHLSAADAAPPELGRKITLLCLWLQSELAVTRTTRCHLTVAVGASAGGVRGAWAFVLAILLIEVGASD